MVTAETDYEFDVVLSGPVFFDVVFTGLDGTPSPGTEVWARDMGTSPGGIANLAVAASRLGLRTTLATVFGDDVYGHWCWDLLSDHEHIDLSRSRIVHEWATPVTVSFTQDGDRAMVTHGRDGTTASELLGDQIRARAALAELGSMAGEAANQAWWQRAAAAGTRIFADIGWDSTGVWDRRDLDPLASCYAFTPNSREAMHYTRTESPRAAARLLAERVPLVVVTCGADGAIAIDSTTGEEVHVPAVPVAQLDATGAGDVFAASFVLGTLREWPLAERLAFSALCAALAVQQLGGSLAAPGWGEIAGWWDEVRASGSAELIRRYSFLADVLPPDRAPAVRRPERTFRLAPGVPLS